MTELSLTRESRWIYSEIGDDPDLRDLIQLFVDEMPSRISTFEDLLREEKWDELRRAAHQLKGAAGSYGYGSVTAAAAAVEQAIRQELPFQEVQRRLEELIDLCRRARVSPRG
ncbi:MAG: Hpt domain-containing protein [Thermogutta sp.]|nr:Hpt domain-containing protein [Thermogutta sp.]